VRSIRLVILAILVVLAMSPGTAAAAIYYVDCTAGSDSNNGTATTTAWRTVGRAAQRVYVAGDQILLKRGCVWTGTSVAPESFVAQGSGSVASPILLADYGTGNLPKIDAFNATAVALENVQHWTVRNLDLTQHGQTPQGIGDDGKDAQRNNDEFMKPVLLVRGLAATTGVVNCGEPCTVRNIRLEGLKVHDGQWNGIFVMGGFYELTSDRYGYVDGVVITGTESWNNHKSGMEFSSTYHKTQIYPTKNVQVLSCNVHDNGGDGVVMGPVENALIDGCTASFNGRLRDARLGLWTWDSKNTTIQFSESHHNMTPENGSGARDGGGFDLDLGTEDGMIQYSWSHDNQGEGFLLMTWPIGFGYTRGVSHYTQMRYNIGERDAKKLAAAITIFGGTLPAVIHNNTIYYEPNRPSGSPMFIAEGAAFGTNVWGKSGKPTVYMYNNIFINNGTVNPSALSTQAILAAGTFNIDNNIWYRVEGGVRFNAGGSILTTFAAWQGKGYDLNGLNTNPGVAGPFGGGPGAYRLTTTSAAIDRGRVVTQGLRGMGTRDYFGTAIPRGATYDIGAVEF